MTLLMQIHIYKMVRSEVFTVTVKLVGNMLVFVPVSG